MRTLRLLFLDLSVVALAAIGALFLRDNLDLEPERLAALGPYLFFALIAGAIILPLVGTNRGFWRYSTFNDFVRVCVAAVLIVFAATSLVFAYNRLDGLARAIPILHLLLAIAFMCALRAAMRLRHSARSRLASAPALAATPRGETVLVVGLNPVAELFLRAVRQFSADSIRVAGVVGLRDRHRGRFLHGVSILGLPDELIAVLHRLEVHGVEVDRIVVAIAPSELSQSARDALVEIEDGSGIVVDYFAERLGFAAIPSHAPLSGRAVIDGGGSDSGALPSLREVLEEGLLRRPYWRWKRVFDFVVALALIVAAAPLMVLVALAVAIDVGVPVIFWQERPGAFGRRLRLYKFRTMRSAHDASGARIPESERSSLIGRILRRSRFDELPQLFNILLGEMSFVGPRPLLPVDQSPAHSGRLAVRPGLTGWAQVHGGREVGAADKAAMDLWYVRNASFHLDCLIALKTLRMVVFGEKTDEGAIAQAWKEAETWFADDASPRPSQYARGIASAR